MKSCWLSSGRLATVHPLVSRLGRLQQLAVFEAAARRGSLTAAGAELGMTQPAVTRHVRALEAAVGAPLFDRSPNRVQLNQAGATLLHAIQTGFSTIDAGIDVIQGQVPAFVLAANPGIAQQWLVPRLDEIQTMFAPNDVHLRLFDRDAEADGGPFDIALHIGATTPSGTTSRDLLDEIVVPVAAPGYAEQHGLDGSTDPAELAHYDLLHLDPRDRAWMSWADWFDQHAGATPLRAPKVVFNNYALVLQNALAGRGIALGWRALLGDLVDGGLLCEVGPETTSKRSTYRLIWPASTSIAQVDVFEEWLRRTWLSPASPR